MSIQDLQIATVSRVVSLPFFLLFHSKIRATLTLEPSLINHIKRQYADANSQLGKDWWDYDDLQVGWGWQDRYEVIRKVGRGKYSEVFEGYDTVNKKLIVIKVLKPIKKKKVKRELKVLMNLREGDNIIGLCVGTLSYPLFDRSRLIYFEPSHRLDVVRDPVVSRPPLRFHSATSETYSLFSLPLCSGKDSSNVRV